METTDEYRVKKTISKVWLIIERINTKTNKVNTTANSTKTSRSVPYLNWANDYIKKNKLSTFMGSNGKMYVKTSDGKVKSVESLEKELRPY